MTQFRKWWLLSLLAVVTAVAVLGLVSATDTSNTATSGTETSGTETLFAEVAGDGIIVARWDNVASKAELEEALTALLSP